MFRKPAFTAALVIVSVLFIGFQNCAKSLPETATEQKSSGGPGPSSNYQIPTLALNLPSASVPRGETIQASAAGGVPPYVFGVLSGPATIDSASGLLQAGTSPGMATLFVRDSKGTEVQTSLAIGVPPPEGVVSGSMKFEAAGSYNFTVPKYGHLRVEVRGAGGGGGGSNVDVYGGTNGGNGGTSSILDVSATGGVGGRGSNYYAGVNYAFGAKGANGSGVGGDTNTAGAGAVGSAGGTYGLTHGEDGGNGGKAVKTFLYGEGSAPPVGAVITVKVGAGGAGGVNGSFFGAQGSGGNGAVYISWDP